MRINHGISIVGALALTACTVSLGALPAAAQDRHGHAVRRTTIVGPEGGRVTTRSAVRWDRDNPNWWHGHPGFAGYHGPRQGYYYAPHHGYYVVPRTYWGRTWVVGATVPASMRVYVVSNPAFYGLTVAPAGYRWIYVNNNITLINRSGVIVRSVPRVW